MKSFVFICLFFLSFIIRAEDEKIEQNLPPVPSLQSPSIASPAIPGGIPATSSLNNQELKDICFPVETGKFWENIWFLSACGFFIALLVAWIICKLLKKPTVIIPPDPFVEAMKELDSAKSLIQKNDQKNFAIKISDAVRNYLDKDFNVPAIERTTEEFMSDAVKELTFLPRDNVKELHNLLINCDLAKFAKQIFLHRELEDWHHSAQDFVKYMHNEKLKQFSTQHDATK